MRPRSATSSAASRCSIVDLPAPDAPVIATSSPRATVRFTPRRTGTRPWSKDLCTSTTSTATSLLPVTADASLTAYRLQGAQQRGAGTRIQRADEADPGRGVERAPEDVGCVFRMQDAPDARV